VQNKTRKLLAKTIGKTCKILLNNFNRIRKLLLNQMNGIPYIGRYLKSQISADNIGGPIPVGIESTQRRMVCIKQNLFD